MERLSIPRTIAEWNERGVCVARPVHKGRATHVWDAEVKSEKTGKPIAVFRRTQMILRAKG